MKLQRPRRRSIQWFIIIAAIVSGWPLIALLHFDALGILGYRRVLIALSLGTMFGQATLAATITALGPGPLVRRLPVCLAWLFCLAFALAINSLLYSQENPAIIMVATLGQWLLAQVPLWILAWRRGLGIRLGGEHTARLPAQLQFGIRQLMILTAIVAVLLGAGRALAPAIKSILDGGMWEEAPVFAFVVATNVVLTLPLALGILLPQRALLACGLGLLFVGLATWCELSLLWVFIPGTGAPDADVVAMFWTMNYLQAAWVLVPLGVLRLGGYRLVAGTESEDAPATA
jgi:hypothetical protein